MVHFFPSHTEKNIMKWPNIKKKIMEFIDKIIELILSCPLSNYYDNPVLNSIEYLWWNFFEIVHEKAPFTKYQLTAIRES